MIFDHSPLLPKRIVLSLTIALSLFPWSASAATLFFRSDHHLYQIQSQKEWRTTEEMWFYNGQPVTIPAEFRVDGDHVPSLPSGFEKRSQQGWNRDAIRATLSTKISSVFDRDPGTVTIAMSASGTVTFDGVGLPGRSIDLDRATALTIEALERGVTDITLPVLETQPKITITDPKLTAMGIREVVTVGESDFTGSTFSRKHNITTGLTRFNGTIIPQGSTFSFDDILGPVNGATGYVKELVIKGDKTLPDYGGGLCQVGTTAYRGVWEYGFPIVARRNHSYAVHYYSPQGTDATIYPPSADMKFLNDSPGALLIQTFMDAPRAYFIYYGTRDTRKSEIIGPYTWDTVAAPPDKVEYTTEIPAGTTRKVGERVPGMKARWYRSVIKDDKEILEPYSSVYEARPHFVQIGIDPAAVLTTGEGGAASVSGE
ncbi:MAG: VanW family protein [Candidatus Peregrinibacteria bacterium]